MVLPYVSEVSEDIKVCLQLVQPQCNLQVWTDAPHHADQGQGQTSRGETLQGCLPDPLAVIVRGSTLASVCSLCDPTAGDLDGGIEESQMKGAG